MKKSVIILLIVILIAIVLIGIYLYPSEKVYELSEEEVLTSGSNEPEEVRDISVTTKEGLFNEVGEAVDAHLEQ